MQLAYIYGCLTIAALYTLLLNIYYSGDVYGEVTLYDYWLCAIYFTYKSRVLL